MPDATPLGGGYVIQCTIFVAMMQVGFMMLETGWAPVRHSQNVALKIFVDMSLSAMTFWAFGFALTAGDDAGDVGLVGYTKWLVLEPDDGELWFAHWSFAALTATIFGGAIAGRAKLMCYVVGTGVASGIIYPIAAHWVFMQSGFLHRLWDVPFLDFAGSAVVHMQGGLVGLVFSVAMGPRLNRFDPDSSPLMFQPHNVLMASCGALLLWVSWYGFNSGAAAFVDGPYGQAVLAGRTVLTTTLSGAAAGTSAFLVRRFYSASPSPYDLNQVCNAILAGLVAITGPCAFVPSWAALIIGVGAAWVFVMTSRLMLRFGIDDPLDVVAVHATPGMWGIISAGLFAEQRQIAAVTGGASTQQWGLLLGGGWHLILMQLLGIACIGAWCLIVSIIMIKILSYFNLTRVDPNCEVVGMDAHKHGTAAYPEFQLVLHTQASGPSLQPQLPLPPPAMSTEEINLEMQAERNARLESVNRALRKSLSDPASAVYGFPRVMEGTHEAGDEDDSGYYNGQMPGIGTMPGREGSFEALTAGTGDTSELDEAPGIIVQGPDGVNAAARVSAIVDPYAANQSHRRGFFSHDMA